MKRLFIVLLAVVAVGVAGCGYTTSSALPSRLKTIHIEPFKNSIQYTSAASRSDYFPLLEVNVHDAVTDRFLFDGNLKVAERGNADLLLKGELVGYNRNVLRYADNDDVEEYRVQIVMKLELIDTLKEETMWQYDRFIGEATYFLSGPQATTESSAVNEAIVDTARRIVEKTIENW